MSLIATTTVRLSAGAYVTSTVMGHRASSTQDAEQAVKALGAKIGIRHLTVVCNSRGAVNAAGNSLEVWDLWGSFKGLKNQSGFALDTLLLVIAIAIIGIVAAIAQGF